jgi:HEAT repeat protein
VVVRLGVPLVLLFAGASLVGGQKRSSVEQLVRQFESDTVFTRQFEVAQAIGAANDRTVLPRVSWLTHDDRCLRGNAFIFAGLGEPRGFDVIVAILGDRSAERGGSCNLRSSIALCADSPRPLLCRALTGDLKDPRAIPILVPLLTDSDVNYIVPWSLGQIGDRSAITPLMASLSDPNPSMRVLAIHALVELKATEALPRLRQLLSDDQRSNFGELESVAHAAQAAIAELQ